MIGAKTGIYSASASGGANLFADAAVAYSLRDLGLGATNATRVRRSSDNAEQDIGFDSNGDLDTEELLSFVGTGGTDNGFVVTWYDQSGNSKDAIQTTAGNQPQLVSSGVIITMNGKPAATGDIAGNPNLAVNNASLRNGNSPYSIFAAMSGKPSAGGIPISYIATSDNFEISNSRNQNRLQTAKSGGGTDLSFGGVDADNIIMSHIRGLDFQQSWGNRFSEGIVDGIGLPEEEGGIDDLFIFGRAAIGSYTEPIAEVIYYDSDQSSNRVAIESNINDYYSIF